MEDQPLEQAVQSALMEETEPVIKEAVLPIYVVVTRLEQALVELPLLAVAQELAAEVELLSEEAQLVLSRVLV
jgi:hypothetical protein